MALPLGTLRHCCDLQDRTLPAGGSAALLFTGMLFVPLYVVTGAWDAGFGIQGWHTLATNPHLAHEPWLAGWRAAIWVHASGGRAVGRADCRRWTAGRGSRDRRRRRDLRDAIARGVACDASACCRSARRGRLWVAIVATVEISVTDFFQVRTFAEEVYTQAALGTFDLIDCGCGRRASPLSAAGLWIGLLLSSVWRWWRSLAAGHSFVATRRFAASAAVDLATGTSALAGRDCSCGQSCSWSPAVPLGESTLQGGRSGDGDRNGRASEVGRLQKSSERIVAAPG